MTIHRNEQHRDVLVIPQPDSLWWKSTKNDAGTFSISARGNVCHGNRSGLDICLINRRAFRRSGAQVMDMTDVARERREQAIVMTCKSRITWEDTAVVKRVMKWFRV